MTFPNGKRLFPSLAEGKKRVEGDAVEEEDYDNSFGTRADENNTRTFLSAS